jgi:hypothetical protein
LKQKKTFFSKKKFYEKIMFELSTWRDWNGFKTFYFQVRPKFFSLSQSFFFAIPFFLFAISFIFVVLIFQFKLRIV